jgi:AcrR family transcriptional regulator
MTVEDKRAVRAAATRSQLIVVGRRLFAERGFAATSTEEIVVQAGVTRGALYYHFRSKEDLFRAVYAAVADEVAARVSALAMAEPEPWDALLAGCSAYLDASLDPAIQRIALLDAPAVLGWEAWREIGFQHLFGLVATGLVWGMAAGEVAEQPVAPLVHVLLGALNEGAMFIARADDRQGARDDVGTAVTQLVKGLRLS